MSPHSTCDVVGRLFSFVICSICSSFNSKIVKFVVIIFHGSVFASVTMQAQGEAPPDLQCKDKFLVQSVVTSAGTTAKDITAETVHSLSLPLLLVR